MYFGKLGILLFCLFDYSWANYETCEQSIVEKSMVYIGNGAVAEKQSVVGTDYDRSAVWRFRTDERKYLTVTIDKVDNGLSLPDKQQVPDCTNDQGGPYVEITTYQDDLVAEKYRGCYNRLVSIANPILSSQRVDVRHCRGLEGTPFKFTIEAKIAGFVYVTKEAQTFRVMKSKNEQWMAFKRRDPTSNMIIHITQISFKYTNESRKCRKSYLHVEDDSGQQLDTECNTDNSGNYRQTISLQDTNLDVINVTFKRASFNVQVQTISLNTASQKTESTAQLTPTPTSTVQEKVGPGVRTFDNPTGYEDEPNTSSEQNENNDPESSHEEHHSRLLLYIGLGLAVAVAIGLVVFTYAIVRHRKYQQAKKELEMQKRSQVTRMSSFSSGSNSGQSGNESGPHSLSNAMYDQVFEAHSSTPSTLNQSIRMTQNAPTDAEIADKRKVRLSQLADKSYIDVPFPLNSRSQLESQTQNHLRPNARENGPNPKLSFTSARPPMPIPAPSQDNPTGNKYETVASPLTAKDMVPPAYASVDEGIMGFAPTSQRNPESSKGRTEGNYNIPNNRKVADLPVSQYTSSEMLSDCDVIDERYDQPSSGDAPPILPKKLFPPVDNNGYLSVIDHEKRRESPTNMYVIPNEAPSESIEKHFQKPVPNPGIKLNTTSMPSLLDDQAAGSVKGPPPKPSRRTKIRSGGTKLLRESSFKQFDSIQYQSPRPSAPDIFVRSAYTSTDDIDRIQTRLQNIHDEALKSSDSEGKLSLPEDALLYASPRSSPASSITSLTGHHSPQAVYATPRPSLPHIFPEEMKRLVANDSSETTPV